jgi:hypothetical protein
MNYYLQMLVTTWLPIPEESNLHKIKSEKTYLSKNQWEDKLAVVWEKLWLLEAV